MAGQSKEVDILQGTLKMMILQALHQGPANGYEIAKYIERRSDELLQVEQGRFTRRCGGSKPAVSSKPSGGLRSPTGAPVITR